jgi:hypothetical protein
MVQELSHVKQESLIHVCKIGLIIHGYFSCIQPAKPAKPAKPGKYPELYPRLLMFSLYFGGSLGRGGRSRPLTWGGFFGRYA